MRAIVLPEPWKAVTAEREIPVPKQGEALLKMVCGGICGSDLASYRGQSAYLSHGTADSFSAQESGAEKRLPARRIQAQFQISAAGAPESAG